MAFFIAVFHFLFLAFLEPSEIVLDEESRVKLAYRHLVVHWGRRSISRKLNVARRNEFLLENSFLTSGRWNDLIQQLRTGPLPDLLDHRPEFGVRVVDIALRLDSQRCPHDGEQRRVEQNGAVAVQRHVHRDESLNFEIPDLEREAARY